ncbi:MAG: acyltransferase [Firmicutes bacterium]|nr:acyltransferase [Bacillota bacterium]
MKPVHDNKRFTQLDALRGAAALSVVFFHYLTRLKITEQEINFFGSLSEKLMYIMKYTPLRIIWLGHEAVILFFVLSGFVMSLSLFSRHKPTYSTYLVKRICRIYIPYVVTILFAILLKKLSYSGEIPALSTAFNNAWQIPDNECRAILSHLALIGDFDTNIYDGSIWSLVHEMRISLIFPLLVGTYKNTRAAPSLLTAFLPSFIAYFIIQYNMSVSSLVMTIHYTGLFLFGTIIAKYRYRLINSTKKFSDIKMLILLFAASLIYAFSAWSLSFAPEIIHDWISAVGTALFIILLMSWDKAIRLFQNKAFVFLGRISYSLYLWHIVILNTLIHGLYGIYPLFVIYLTAFAVTIFISWISHKYIELPSMKLGKILTGTNK